MKDNFLSYTAARAFAWTLKLKSEKEWREWSKSGMRPSNIPSNSYKTHGDEFISWPDFLGYKGRAPPGSMRPFKAARVFARKLKLGSVKEWKEWCKSGMRPPNIPSNPYKVYGDEFISMPDFLGYAPTRGASGGSRSSSSSSSSATTARKTKRKDAPPPKPSQSSRAPSTARSKKTKQTSNQTSANNTQSRKRARAADDASDDDDLSGLPGGSKQTVVKVENVGGFSIVSAATDLKHTACGLLSQGPTTS